MAKSNKTALKFGAGMQNAKKNSVNGLPTQGRDFSTRGKPDNFAQNANNQSGFPKQDRGFSTLGKLNKEGSYTNSKFNQALAGKGEEISSQFLGTQQLNLGGGFGNQIDDPKVPYFETFYILAEDGDVLNSGPCGMESDPLLWLV